MRKHKRDSFEKKQELRQQLKDTKEKSRSIIEQKKIQQQLKREREAVNKKRKEENAKKSEVVQVVRNIQLLFKTILLFTNYNCCKWIELNNCLLFYLISRSATLPSWNESRRNNFDRLKQEIPQLWRKLLLEKVNYFPFSCLIFDMCISWSFILFFILRELNFIFVLHYILVDNFFKHCCRTRMLIAHFCITGINKYITVKGKFKKWRVKIPQFMNTIIEKGW